MPPKNILALLKGGDRRTIGRSNQVTAIVSKDSGQFPQLIAGLWSSDQLVRMRTADAAEKVTRKHPEFLLPYKKELLGLMTETEQQELRWHLPVMVPRLVLNPRELQAAISALQSYLKDRSSIVKTFALQGLADLAQADPAKGEASVRPGVIEILREATRNGTPAMKARSRKLLIQLERVSERRGRSRFLTAEAVRNDNTLFTALHFLTVLESLQSQPVPEAIRTAAKRIGQPAFVAQQDAGV
jgi:hypothetical protein